MLSDLVGKVEHMALWGKDRRRKQRYRVCWSGTLEARFPDFEGRIPVTISDFSALGARLQSDAVFLNNHHLISALKRPDLTLKIHAPAGVFETRVRIIWYRWAVETGSYEIALEFTETGQEYLLMADRIIRELGRKKCEH